MRKRMVGRELIELCFAVLVVLGSCPSCTLLGAGIGAGVDWVTPGPYRSANAEEQRRLEPGDQIRLHLKNGRQVDGRYLGVSGPTPRDPEVRLLVDHDTVEAIATSDTSGVDIEVAGKGWLYGGAIGLVVDVAVVIVIIVTKPLSETGNQRGMELDLG